MPHRFQRFDRAAAARTLNHSDERHPVFARHFLGLHQLAVDCSIGRPSAHGEIIALDDDWPALNFRAAKDHV